MFPFLRQSDHRLTIPHRSPDPERQSDAQKETPASNVNEQGQNPEGSNAADASKNDLKGLESNPKHVLADAAETKTGKGTSSDK